MSTKTKNLIEACTNLKKNLRIGKFFLKHKFSCAEVLRHNLSNKLITKFFSLKKNYKSKYLLKI